MQEKAYTGMKWRETMRELDYGKMGMRIRQVRKAKGWSQEKLAGKCGISMSFLGHIERGTRIMSMETFACICETLESGADELMWGSVNPSGAVLELWHQREQEKKKDKNQNNGKPDSYAMYVRIMKSVAQIMNEV